MIKDLKYKIPCKSGGNITSGIKVLSSNNKEIPKAVDYFNIMDFPELVQAYGEKPNKLVLFFPTNKIEDFLDINNVLYGSNNALIRKCDGVNCFHRIDNEVEGHKFTSGSTTPCICKEYELPRTHKKVCKPFFWMKAFVGDIKLGKVDSPMCYLFKSGSKNSAENIISELEKVKNLTGGSLIGIPFGLLVKMVPSAEKPNVRYPIWELQGLGSITQMIEWNESVKMLIPKKSDLKQLSEAVHEEEEPFEGGSEDEQEYGDDSIHYWIAQLPNIKTEADLDKWQEVFKQDLGMFGGPDEVELATAIGNRRSELKGNKANTASIEGLFK